MSTNPHTWTGLMAGFAPAPTDRTTTTTGDTGGPTSDPPIAIPKGRPHGYA
jgi:hypothetical protein